MHWVTVGGIFCGVGFIMELVMYQSRIQLLKKYQRFHSFNWHPILNGWIWHMWRVQIKGVNSLQAAAGRLQHTQMLGVGTLHPPTALECIRLLWPDGMTCGWWCLPLHSTLDTSSARPPQQSTPASTAVDSPVAEHTAQHIHMERRAHSGTQVPHSVNVNLVDITCPTPIPYLSAWRYDDTDLLVPPWEVVSGGPELNLTTQSKRRMRGFLSHSDVSLLQMIQFHLFTTLGELQAMNCLEHR